MSAFLITPDEAVAVAIGADNWVLVYLPTHEAVDAFYSFETETLGVGTPPGPDQVDI